MENNKITSNALVIIAILLVLWIQTSQCRTHLYENVKISKCCPVGSELKMTSDSQETNKIYYECAMLKGFNKNRTIFGYNLDINDEIHIPTCSDVEMVEFDVDGGLISSDGCIDMYNGLLHGLKCSDKFQVEVHKIYKCCAEGFSYDINNRQCIDNGQAPDSLANLIGNSVAIFETKVPYCRENEIFIEFTVDVLHSKLIRGGIQFPKADFDLLPPETFCIEEIVDVESNNTISGNNSRSIIIRTCRPSDICKDIPCVRRCCRNEMMYEKVNGSTKCVPYPRNIKPTFYDIGSLTYDGDKKMVEPAAYGLIDMQKCEKYLLSNTDPDDKNYISHLDGSLHVSSYQQPLSNNDYCVEFVNMGEVNLRTFVCFRPFPQTKFKYYATGLTISCFFLTITLICYACLPKLLNLHGKTLVCYVISLLSAYITLAIVQFQTETKMENCYFVAYFIFFSFLAAFCWQSIMCFDIWWTFGSVRTSRGMRKTKELRRFLLYSLYAWGVPSLLTMLTVLVDYYSLVPEIWSPQLVSKCLCWFGHDSWRGHFIFFLFPIGLHILTNAILFIMTAIHCSKIKNEIQRMQSFKDNDSQDKKRRFLADKAKYAMNIKLFFVMGVSWSMEIIATLLQEPEQLWYVADSINILQGVLVFFIFVFKVKVWNAILHRLGAAPSTSKGPATVTTSLSINSNGRLGKSASTSTLSTSNTNLNVIRKVA